MWSLEVHLEHKYSINSADGVRAYDNYYYGIGCEKYNAIEYIGIRCTVTGANALLIASGSPKGLNEKSYIVDNNQLLVCVGNSVFSLNTYDLTLNWTQVCDDSCCFQIYRLKNYYLIHGELEITAVDFVGKKIWSFSGRDIFVTQDEIDVVSFSDGKIYLKDWENNKYILDICGKLVSN
jgi:hypothetical protein